MNHLKRTFILFIFVDFEFADLLIDLINQANLLVHHWTRPNS